MFKSLGPVAIFSAKRHWSAPRTVQLQKSNIGRTRRRDANGQDLGARRDRSMDNGGHRYSRQPVTRQNGVYINGYNNNNSINNNNNISSEKLRLAKDDEVYHNSRNEPRQLGIKGSRFIDEPKCPIRRISSECSLTNVTDDRDEAKCPSDGFGFSVRGDAPVIVAGVEPRSLADVRERNCISSTHTFYILRFV